MTDRQRKTEKVKEKNKTNKQNTQTNRKTNKKATKPPAAHPGAEARMCLASAVRKSPEPFGFCPLPGRQGAALGKEPCKPCACVCVRVCKHECGRDSSPAQLGSPPSRGAAGKRLRVNALIYMCTHIHAYIYIHTYVLHIHIYTYTHTRARIECVAAL